MHIDGFRFDLASIFARGRDGSIDLTTPPIFDQIAGDADFDGIHLIAEPWDAGGLYQLGSRFPGVTLDAVERPLSRHTAAVRPRRRRPGRRLDDAAVWQCRSVSR